MHVRKWYLDLVTDEGEVFVGYWASVRWGPLRLRAAAVLLDGAEGVDRTTLRPGPAPVVGVAGVSWSVPAWRHSGAWRPSVPGLRRELWEGDAGAVRWNCVCPGATATVTVAGITRHGLGYVEELELTAAPWSLPISELRWGRLVTNHHAVVWIQWTGEAPLNLVLLDGRPSAGPVTIADDGVVGDAVTVTLDQPRVFRDAELGAGVLASIPALGRRVPDAMLATRETKWVSRGTALVAGVAHRGWAVHERVRFGPREGDRP